MPLWKQLLVTLYYHGTRPYRWAARRAAAAEGRMPITVLFYHRVADERPDAWTVSNRVFARQIGWLKDRFEMISLEEVQRRIRSGVNRRPSVSITFDDGYADNCHRAIPLLIEQRIPCTYFVTAENVLEGKPFAHDMALGNPPSPNTVEQLRAMADAGVEIGAHAYTHADLGRVTDRDQLRREVVTAGIDLQEALGHRIRYFAFPFGHPANLSRDAFDLAHRHGYEAVCSAYGGYNFPGGDPFHIQRLAVDADLIGLKNRATVDPRKRDLARFDYLPPTDSQEQPSGAPSEHQPTLSPGIS